MILSVQRQLLQYLSKMLRSFHAGSRDETYPRERKLIVMEVWGEDGSGERHNFSGQVTGRKRLIDCPGPFLKNDLDDDFGSEMGVAFNMLFLGIGQCGAKEMGK